MKTIDYFPRSDCTLRASPTRPGKLRSILKAGLLLLMGAAVTACAATSWKEEVLLHDGSKIVVERSQSYGGRHEIGQAPPIKEQDLTFKLPGSNKAIVWKSEYGEDIGRANFNLLALHVLRGTPYVVASPNLCLSYNKWGRPNPPYVFFKFDGNAWQRIPLLEFPEEFKDINVVVSTKAEEKSITAQPIVTTALVKEINRGLEQPEYKTILREPLQYDPDCIPMVGNGLGRWRAAAWFESKPTLEACVNVCRADNFDEKHCPCNGLFQRK